MASQGSVVVPAPPNEGPRPQHRRIAADDPDPSTTHDAGGSLTAHDNGTSTHEDEEELPSYNIEEGLPTYAERPDHSPSNTRPLLTFHLRQQSRTNQVMVPFGPSQPQVSYRIINRVGPKLFSRKKADITVLRIAHGRASIGERAGSVSLDPSGSASLERTRTWGANDGTNDSNDREDRRPSRRNNSVIGLSFPLRRGSEAPADSPPPSPSPTEDLFKIRDTGEEIAWLDFDNESKLPWMPRANLTVLSKIEDFTRSPSGDMMSVQRRRNLRVALSSPNFRDWRFTIGSNLYIWFLLERPTMLELFSADLSGSPIARFTHSNLGSRAVGGAEVGTLDVFKLLSAPEGPDVEVIVSSVGLVMAHFRRMGKHLWAYGRPMHSGLTTRLVEAGGRAG